MVGRTVPRVVMGEVPQQRKSIGNFRDTWQSAHTPACLGRLCQSGRTRLETRAGAFGFKSSVSIVLRPPCKNRIIRDTSSSGDVSTPDFSSLQNQQPELTTFLTLRQPTLPAQPAACFDDSSRRSTIAVYSSRISNAGSASTHSRTKQPTVQIEFSFVRKRTTNRHKSTRINSVSHTCEFVSLRGSKT